MGRQQSCRVRGLGPSLLPPDLDPRFHKRIIRSARRDGTFYLGLSTVCELLDAMGDDLGYDLRHDDQMRDLTEMRNNSIYGHDTLSVDIQALRRVMKKIGSLLHSHFPELAAFEKRCTFPDPRVFSEDRNQQTGD